MYLSAMRQLPRIIMKPIKAGKAGLSIMTSVPKLLLAIVACSVLGGQQVNAQTGSSYADRMLNSYRAGNSASTFTSKSIQNRVLSRVVPTYSFSSVNRNVLGPVFSPPRKKPFSSYQPPSPVSPYLALDQPFQNSATTYYTQIRPMQEQERFNQQAAARSQQIQRQLNAIAAQGPYSPVGDEQRAPTGHTSTFMNYGGQYQNHGGYYQMPAPRY
jgi:hypothetical protein